METLMRIKDLHTRFHTQDGTVNAVNGISYAMQAGEVLGVVGESGCGKSVHALSIMGLIPKPPGDIPKGEVIFRGRDLLKLPPSKQRLVRGAEIAMVFQDPMTSLNPVLTIGRQITEALRLHLGMDNKQARERAAELLAMVGIPLAQDRLDDYPHQFSGGMRQRVMIAMALSCNAQVLVADEPTTALDVTIQAQILELIDKLSTRMGTAVILITHDLGVVAGMCNQVCVMYAGKIVEKAATEDLYERPSHPYTEGLIKSVPRMDTTKKGNRLFSIEGQPPNVIDLPPCCPFHPRCHKAMEVCRHAYPPVKDLGKGHEVACWLYADEAEKTQALKEANGEEKAT